MQMMIHSLCTLCLLSWMSMDCLSPHCNLSCMCFHNAKQKKIWSSDDETPYKIKHTKRNSSVVELFGNITLTYMCYFQCYLEFMIWFKLGFESMFNSYMYIYAWFKCCWVLNKKNCSLLQLSILPLSLYMVFNISPGLQRYSCKRECINQTSVCIAKMTL